MFGIFKGFDSVCLWHRFKVGVLDIIFFEFGFMLISIAELDLTLKLLFKLLFKIVVIVTVSFLNSILPLNVVLLWYLDSFYACLGVHTLHTH